MTKVKPNQQPQPQKAIVKEAATGGLFTGADGAFTIKYPLVWLALAIIILYYPSFSFGYTELDDSIFIRDFHEYNEDFSNVWRAFGRGLFSATKDPYYRPIFSDSMIINYKFSEMEIGGYHVVNVLLHIITTSLLYKLLTRLKIKQLHAFLLAAIFAVHPVLAQAVAWIPGRNDTLLAVFSLSFFIFVIDYLTEGKQWQLIASVLALLLALFTKETAVFVAPVAFLLLVFMLRKELMAKRSLVLYGTWVGCFAVWYIARSLATVHIATTIGTAQMFTDFIGRLPIIIQYLGKIFLPLNLSVFPIQQDTVMYFGLAALGIIAALLYFSKEVNWRTVGVGFAVFLFFLLPALLVPSNLNEQVFEHRLYLPMIGILIILSETVVFKKLADKQSAITVLAVCGLFAVGNFFHQKNFSDPFSFWHQAATTSPHSAYASMMLGARHEKEAEEKAYAMHATDERRSWIKEPRENMQASYNLFHKAYALNPNEKYLNFYYGCMLQKKDSILASEPYLIKEKGISNYYECDFYLARVAMTKGDTVGSINYLKSYLERDPANPQANNNLLLMLYTRGQLVEAKAQVANMQMRGMTPPGEIVQRLNSVH